MLIRTSLVFLLVAGFSTSVNAQTTAAPTTQQLIEQLGNRNEQIMMAAIEALTKQGATAVPALVEALDRRKECHIQFVASGVLRKIEPTHGRIEPALAFLARGECSGNSEQDLVFKQESAFALSYSVSGLSLLADMVSHRDVLTRRRVAFVFEDLTEKMNSTMEEFRPPAALVEPTAQALPKLAPFLSDRDERVRCVTLEAMEQASASRHVSIAAAAKGVLAGKRVNCGLPEAPLTSGCSRRRRSKVTCAPRLSRGR